MRIFCMSDIHGCIAEFEEALGLIRDHLDEEDTMLLLLGDYIHGGADGCKVLDKIMEIQDTYGADKVVALLGNHEDWLMNGSSGVNQMDCFEDEDSGYDGEDDEAQYDKYTSWIGSLPKYFVEGNTIFVHAGIDEEAGEMWEWETSDDVFTSKYPADVGQIPGLDMKVVAGHIGTAEISGDPRFHDIFYDGESHYYIDGTVLSSGYIPVMMVDTDEDKYYRVTEGGIWEVAAWEE